MGRIAGRNGRVYFDVAGGGAASPLPFIARWTLNQVTNKDDVTAMGDATKTYVAGLPDASGSFSGFYDDASAQTYTAAADGLARKFYLYPSTSSSTTYWFGTIFADFSADGAVDGPVTISANWNAASGIVKVG